MQSKKIITFLSLGIFLASIGAGCNPFADDGSENTNISDTPVSAPSDAPETEEYGDQKMAEDTALSNPATVYCLSRNGEFVMKKTLAGTTEGYCTLPDGTECEVWSLYKGECAAINEPETEIEEETATSTDDVMEDTESSTSTTMDSETPAETGNSESQDEEQNDDSDLSDNDADQTPEKKKIEGAIDIAVKPGEEEGEIIMSWDTHDLSAPEGYIVMLAGDEDLSYPTRFHHELEREESYSFTWIDLNPEKEYFFRVCIKQNDGCGTYSSIISTYPRSNEDE